MYKLRRGAGEMSRLMDRLNETATAYYFYFLSWGYYFFSAGTFAYKKIRVNSIDEKSPTVYSYS